MVVGCRCNENAALGAWGKLLHLARPGDSAKFAPTRDPVVVDAVAVCRHASPLSLSALWLVLLAPLQRKRYTRCVGRLKTFAWFAA
jgi:hypothetical protein